MSQKILDRYPILGTVPELASYKALLLDLGVDCDHDLLSQMPKLAQMKTKHRVKKHRVRGGRLIDTSTDPSIIPSEVILDRNGRQTLSKVSYKPDSPLRMIVAGGRLHLIDTVTDERLDVDISPVGIRPYSSLKIPSGRLATEGTILGDYVQVLGIDRIGILPYSGCQPKRPGHISGMPSLNTLVDFGGDASQWWEHYGPAYLDGIAYAFRTLLETEEIEPHKHLQLMAGNLLDLEAEWEICTQVAERLGSIRDLSTMDSYLNIVPPSDERRGGYLQRAKDLGFRNIAFNLEVIGDRAFQDVCPGKAHLFGYQGMVDSLKESVGHFGHGNVRSNFVLGAQLVDELLDGIRELAEHGIVADYSVFVPKRGTPWAKRSSPDMETIVYFTRQLADIYRQHGFRGIYCGLSSRSNILHEVLDE